MDSFENLRTEEIATRRQNTLENRLLSAIKTFQLDFNLAKFNFDSYMH